MTELAHVIDHVSAVCLNSTVS